MILQHLSFLRWKEKFRERKLITHLKLSDGRETTEKREIISQVLSFYEELYSAEPCDSEAMDFFSQWNSKIE